MYDYVIVGGGSAGCVLAARLSEERDASVLLLEAGGADRNRLIHIPAGYFRLNTEKLSWGYRTAPQRHLGGRIVEFTQARVVGGGSSINAQVFTRGSAEDYDRWAYREGCDGWSSADVLPYFLRMEDNDRLAGPYHGAGGPLGVSSTPPRRLTLAFLQACHQAGIPYSADFNGAAQAGAGLFQTTTRAGRRCSAATAYLKPALARPNLTVLTNCHARRVIIDRGRAVGLEYERDGEACFVRAGREVVLTCGGVGSPRLLLLSGIGPAAALEAADVRVVHDLPGVGRNFHDHYAVDAVFELSGRHSLDHYRSRPWMALAGLRYALTRRGPAASTVVEAGAFWRAHPSSDAPDTQLHFVVGAGLPPNAPRMLSRHGCMLNAYQLQPRSRGTITLQGPDPRLPPVIDPNYLADPHDLEMTIAGIALMREIMRQKAMAPLLRREHMPGASISGRAELAIYARRFGRTGYHPSGACRMGDGADAVVGPDLRVRGLGGLRVCDSSVMPSVVSSNTNAPTIMIAERAADLIRGRLVLPARMPAEQSAGRLPAPSPLGEPALEVAGQARASA